MNEPAKRGAMGYAPAVDIGDDEFRLFQRFMRAAVGVGLADSKRALVRGRLSKRLQARGCATYKAYFRLITQDEQERQQAIDLLTTNETYFFREPKHFDFLRATVLPAYRSAAARIWSAACSSGEEVYSIAMTAADALGLDGWEVLGTDINQEVLRRARLGHYPMQRIDGISRDYLRRYCLRGKGRQTGTILIDRPIRERVRFRQVNLHRPLPRLGRFDVIFLRNVMIYFPYEVKREVASRVAELLVPGGYLFIGHSESLNGMESGLRPIAPSIYRRSLR